MFSNQRGNDASLGVGVGIAAGARVAVERVDGGHIGIGERKVKQDVYKRQVGQGIRESGVDRKDVFVTTKLAVTDMREGNVEAAFDKSLKLLGMDYVDMYLIHWPEPGKVKQTWAVLEKLYKEGRARAIGVSNFNKEHLDLLRDFEVVPAMNQMEFHPELVQPELRAYCEQLGIAYEAWSPLGTSTVLGLPTINEIAQKHGKSAAQVIIRWDLQHGVITIPKSVRCV